MKLQNTLIIAFISLILFSLNTDANELSEKNAACNSALNKGDIAGAARLADEVLKHNANNRDGLICKGRLLGTQGKFDEALSALKQAETLSKEPFEHIIANILIGNVYKVQQQYAEAVASYQNSLAVAEESKNEKYARANDNLIGDVQSRIGDYNAALASYQAGSKLAMNDNERAESYELLAATYKALSQYGEAAEYQLKATQMQKKAGTLDQYAIASLELGRIFILARDYPSAEKTLTRLAQFCKDNGGIYYEAKAILYLAQNRVASGDAAGAKSILSDARNIAKNAPDAELMAEIDAFAKKLTN